MKLTVKSPIIFGFRTIKPSEYRTIGPSDNRDFGLLDIRTVTAITWIHTASVENR